MAEFYEVLAAVYDDVFPLSAAQVSFVAKHLPPAPSQVVDLGCSTGALARRLAESGYDVLGVDLSASMIGQAEAAAGSLARPGKLEFKVADMRWQILSVRLAGVLLCLGNTLVHLTNRDDLAKFLRNCYQALQPGGRFIGQIVNYDRILRQDIRQLPSLQGQQGNELLRFYHEREDGLLDFVTHLRLQHGLELDSTVTLYPLRKEQLQQLLRLAGFTDVQYYGSYQGDEWSEQTFHTIFVATKCE